MAPTVKVQPMEQSGRDKAKLTNPMIFKRKNVIKLTTAKLLGLKPGIKNSMGQQPADQTLHSYPPLQDCEPFLTSTEHQSSYFPKTLPSANLQPVDLIPQNYLQQTEYGNENENTLNIAKNANRNRLAVLNDGSVRKIVILPKGSLSKIRPETPERLQTPPPPETTEIPPKDSFFDGFLESLPKESLEHYEPRGIPIAKKFLPFLRKGVSATFNSVAKILAENEMGVSEQPNQNSRSDELLIRRFETLNALFNRIELELQNQAECIHEAQLLQSFLHGSDEKSFDIFENQAPPITSNYNNKILSRAQSVVECTKKLQQTINDAAIFEKNEFWCSGNESKLGLATADVNL